MWKKWHAALVAPVISIWFVWNSWLCCSFLHLENRSLIAVGTDLLISVNSLYHIDVVLVLNTASFKCLGTYISNTQKGYQQPGKDRFTLWIHSSQRHDDPQLASSCACKESSIYHLHFTVQTMLQKKKGFSCVDDDTQCNRIENAYSDLLAY